jgi:hypothetical protein
MAFHEPKKKIFFLYSKINSLIKTTLSRISDSSIIVFPRPIWSARIPPPHKGSPSKALGKLSEIYAVKVLK